LDGQGYDFELGQNKLVASDAKYEVLAFIEYHSSWSNTDGQWDNGTRFDRLGSVLREVQVRINFAEEARSMPVLVNGRQGSSSMPEMYHPRAQEYEDVDILV